MTSKSLKLLLLAIALGVCTTTWLTTVSYTHLRAHET